MEDKNLPTIQNLKVGQKAFIRGYGPCNPAYRVKLLSMGLTSGTQITLENRAPLGDPIHISLRGYHLTLRRDEAKVLQLELCS